MPDPSRNRNPPADQILTVTVRRISPAGLIVGLPDGREGLIRERELAWEAKAREGWAERYKPDDKIQVIPLGKERERRPELSIRLAQSGSWFDIESRYPVGSLVNGVVTGIMPYGAFIELEAGITGLLHISRLPAQMRQSLTECFWPGDLVKAIVDDIDVQRQRIALSMLALPDQRWRHTSLEKEDSFPSVASAKPAIMRSTMDLLLAGPPMVVLVVEDEPDQRKSVADWLRDAGQVVEVAGSAEEALEQIVSRLPDMVLMDVGLPEMNGIEAAQRIRAEWPEMRCALMTDWSHAEHHADELRRLRDSGVSLIIKPLLPEDLLGVLLEDPTSPLPALSQTISVQSILQYTPVPFQKAETNELAGALSRLLKAVRADKVIVFELQTDGRQIKLLEQKGSAPLRLSFISELIHSPVRDVAEDEQVVAAQNAQETAARRFLHLKPLLDFESCLGVPVPVRLRNRYALFVFFAHSTILSETILARAEATAGMVGVWLERRQFIKQTADLNRIAVLGQLGRTLVHEISGRLTPINLTLERLRAGCDKVEQCAATSPELVVTESQRASQELRTLAQQAQSLARTTRSFSRMTRSGQEEIVLLEEVIREAVDVLSDTAAAAHVKVVLQPAPRLFFTRAQVTSLQQVMVNILQNAIQQLQLFRPQLGGRVEIRLAQAALNGRQMLQVGIEDDGPGIHRRLWERIFEMDYTTRSEGSGLGLYLSRSLIESLGGRTYLADSHRLWGTTFVIELPFRL